MSRSEQLHFEGCNFFRFRIAYSLLSGRPVVIDNIRSEDDHPGLRDHETRLLKLVVSISNGIRSEISRTGTSLRFVPGVLLGGELSFDGGTQRCISYYLEFLLLISPFCKRPLRAKIQGVTNAPNEISVEALKHAWLPVYTKFVLNDENLDMKILSRGVLPDGGGKVFFSAPIVKTLRPAHRDKPGKICKIRGSAWVCKVSPSLAHRLIDASKQMLRGYIADVYITVDQRKGAAGGNSPGFGITLWAETTEGVVMHGEAMSQPRGADAPILPEDVATLAATRLLDQIYQGGCTDGSAQALAATFMALGEKDASRFLFGDLNMQTVGALRHLKEFFGMVFKLEDYAEKLRKDAIIKKEKDTADGKEEAVEEEEEKKLGSKRKVLLTGIGVGYSNLNKLIL